MASIDSNTAFIPDFYDIFLSEEGTSIYRGSSWIVKFNNISSIESAIKKATQWEPNEWNIATGFKYVTNSNTNEKGNGCMFAQAINIPGESFQPVPGGNISSNAFIRPYIGAGRNAFPLLRMSFLETITSFTDNFLRPWVLATQTFGMLAPQNANENYRLNSVECFKLSPYSSGEENTPDITMQYVFYNVSCVSVGEEEFNYNPINSPIVRDAQFVYSHYAINPTINTSTTSNKRQKPPIEPSSW